MRVPVGVGPSDPNGEASSASAIIVRLVRWGLMDAGDVVDHGMTVRPIAGRHGALAIESRGVGLVVKAARDPLSAQQIAREASSYAERASHEALKELGPRLRHYDRATSTLVLDLVPSGPDDGHDPREAVLRPSVAVWLGHAIATLHASTGRSVHDGPPPARAPWLTRLGRLSPSLAAQMPWSAAAVARLVQGAPGVADGLAALRADWTPSCVCHMDLRLENVVVPPDGSGAAPRIVDWEDSAVGDPAWDIGWALGSCLALWVDSMPSAEGVPVEALIACADRSLEEVSGAAGAIWAAYRGGVPSSPPLIHVMRCAAVRLLAVAMERVEAAGRLSGSSILHAQLATSILERPDASAHELLGTA